MRSRIPAKISLLLASSIVGYPAVARATRPIGGVPWYASARRLTGESAAVKAGILRVLREDPTLESKLTKVIARAATDEVPTTEWFLALDVVSALGLKSLRPVLMQAAERDDTGYVIHALNTLADAESLPALAVLYRRILERDTSPRASRVSALDSIARFPGPSLAVDTLAHFLESGEPELRESALGYVRTARNAVGSLSAAERSRLLEIGLSDRAPNPRARALYLVRELSAERDPEMRAALRRSAIRDRLAAIADAPLELDLATARDPIAEANLRNLAAELRESLFGAGTPPPNDSLRERISALVSRWFARAGSSEFVRALRALPARFGITPLPVPGRSRPAHAILVSFGYKDARPARFVADRYERLVWLGRLEARCARTFQRDCGYVRDPDDPETWNRPEVAVTVLDASSGADDVENRKDPYQAWKSARAREVFSRGILRLEAVFYNGHSRAGGGPDFDPPQLLSDSEVDYGFYQRNQPGLARLVSDLEGRRALRQADREKNPTTEAPAGRKPARWVLGLFSCTSGPHFAQGVTKADGSVQLVSSTRLLYFSDALTSTQRALQEWARQVAP